MSSDKFYQFMTELEEGTKERSSSYTVATLVDSRGSAPQDVGAKIIFNHEKILFGTIGGGKVEAKVIELGRELILDAQSSHHFVKWNLQRDVGMTCGGEVQIFFEVFNPKLNWNVAIFGAGHVSIELNKVLSNLNCNISCFDTRADWLDKVSSKVSKKLCSEADTMASEIEKLPSNTFVVLMTMGHKSDVPILKEALKRDFPYLGVIGSLAKRKVMEHELVQDGILERDFRCPIGEQIGDNSPSEIAISITAELLKVKDEYFKTLKRKELYQQENL